MIPSAAAVGDGRARRTAAVAAFSLLVLAAFAGTLRRGDNFVGRDLVVYNLPIERAVHDAYARGRLPVWDAAPSGGRPLLSNPNAGAFYPVRPLLSVLPFAAAMRISPVLHWSLAGAGMILLLTGLGASGAAALVGASTYVFSGVTMSEVFFPNFLPGVALLPWALWAWVRPAATGARRVFPAAVVFALLVANGDVFTTGIALLAVALWILVEPGVPRRPALLELAAALALAALLAAPQILATALVVPETRRAVGGMRFAEVFAFSLSPWRLLELVAPYPFGETWSLDVSRIWGRPVARFLFATLYAGAIAPIAWFELARRPRSSRGARFVVALAGVSLFLAAAPSLAPAPALRWRSPVPLRFPEKFAIGMALALAVAAGLALDRFRAAAPPRVLLALAVALTASALLAALPGPGLRLAAAAGAKPADAAAAARQLSASLAEGGLYAIATLVALELFRRGAPARAAAVGLLALVPIAAGRRVARAESEAAVLAPTPFARAIARRDPAGAYRTLDESVFLPPSRATAGAPVADPGASDLSRRAWYLQTGGLWGRGTVFNSDLDAGDLTRMDSLKRYSIAAIDRGGVRNAAAWLGAFALRFGVRWRDQAALPGYAPFGRDGLQSWDENPLSLADLRLVPSWREVRGSLEALAAMPEAARGEAVVESGRAARGVARSGSIRVVERSPERLRLDLAAPEATWLFVLRGFWRFRDVRLDGAPVDAVPAQLAFTAVPIPAGAHRLEWRERVPGGEISWLGPLFFLLAAAWTLPRRAPGALAA